MHRTMVLAAILLCGCASSPVRQFDQAQANHVRHVMYECAQLISEVSFLLTDAEADWHYQRCLIENNATI